jgi:hypothetical protein
MKRAATLALALLVPAVAGAEPEITSSATPFDAPWSVGVGFSYPLFQEEAGKAIRETLPFLTLVAPIRLGQLKVEPELGLGGSSIPGSKSQLGDLRWYRLGLGVGYETAPSPGTRLSFGPWVAGLLRIERSAAAVNPADPLFDWQAGIAAGGEVALSSSVAMGGALRAGVMAFDDWTNRDDGTYAFGEVQLSARFAL